MLTAINTRSETVVARLKSISAIKPGQYWCTYTGTAQERGKITSVLRTVYYWDEERKFNVADITECINNSFRILSDIIQHCESTFVEVNARQNELASYKKIMDDIKVNVISAKDGISNLKVTYYDDEVTKGNLEKLVELINTKHSEFEGKLSNLLSK